MSTLTAIWHRHHRTRPHANPPDFADVSNYQGNPDWDTYAASGRTMAICKATEGNDWTDAKTQYNRDNMSRVGLECGLYHFAGSSGNKTIADPTTEANFFLSTVGPLGSNEFPVLDFELPYNLTPAQQASWINTWCTTVEQKTGKTPWLYSGMKMLNAMDTSQISRFPLWIASYPSSPNPQNPPQVKGWQHVTAWQYTDNDTIPGVSGACDDSYLYGSVPDEQRGHGHHHHHHRS